LNEVKFHCPVADMLNFASELPNRRNFLQTSVQATNNR